MPAQTLTPLQQFDVGTIVVTAVLGHCDLDGTPLTYMGIGTESDPTQVYAIGNWDSSAADPMNAKIASIAEALTELGIMLLYSEEYSECTQCWKAVSITGDAEHLRYVMIEDELVCVDCVSSRL